MAEAMKRAAILCLAAALLLGTVPADAAPTATEQAFVALRTGRLTTAQLRLIVAQAYDGDRRAAEAVAWMFGTGRYLGYQPSRAFEWYLRAYLFGMDDALDIAGRLYDGMSPAYRVQLDPMVVAVVKAEQAKRRLGLGRNADQAPRATEAALPSLPRFTGDPPAAAEIIAMIREEAAAFPNLSFALAKAVARVESNFKANALSPMGARGVMQIMPATGLGEFGAAPDTLWDARTNIRLGLRFLSALIDRYGSVEIALSHYNGGSAVGPPGAARVIPATRDYVDAVLAWSAHYQNGDGGPAPQTPRNPVFEVSP